MVFSSSHSPNRFYVLTLKISINFFSIWIFHHVSHLLYYHFPSRFSLLMQIFGLHSPSRCLLLFFVYVSQTLSATEQKHFLDLLHP